MEDKKIVRCNKCNKFFILENEGEDSVCSTCIKEKMDKLLEKFRIEERDKQYKYLYNISYLDYHDILILQNYSCGICEKSIKEISGNLHVDHCHKTGKVRGLLCTGCNTSIGKLGDNSDGIRKALEYLLRAESTDIVKLATGRL